MVKILMHGCNGAMGQVISNLALENEEAKIVAGVDISGEAKNDYPVFTSLEACDVPVDVIIDFSTAKAVDGLLDYVAAKKIPVVLCTTGLSEDQIAKTKEVSKEVAVLKSANMSLGVNTVFKLAAMAAQILASKGYDMEIVEKHHNRKLDSPSGTAILIANAIKSVRKGLRCVMGRNGKDGRAKDEIGIHSVRVGNIVGEHCVIVGTDSQTITLKHEAHERSLFAEGAISAAKFIADKENGLYDMNDMIR